MSTTAEPQPPSGNPNLHPVVVGVDYGEHSSLALNHAIGMATMGLMELHVCHAIAPRPEIESSDRQLSVGLGELARFVRPHIPPALNERVGLHLAFASPVDALVQLAVDTEAELIIVGSPRGRRVEQLVRGSTARGLLSEAPCPVLIALPFEHAGRARLPIRYGTPPNFEGHEPNRASATGAAIFGETR